MDKLSRTIFNQVYVYLLVLAFITPPGYIIAAEVPGFQKTVALSAQEESATEFIQSLFSQLGVPVSLDTDITGTVNGQFDGSAKDIFEQIANTFNVHLYFNRTVAYVYRADQLVESVLPLSTRQSEALLKTVERMGLQDAKNRLNILPGGAMEVIGIKRFQDKIEDLSVNIQRTIKTKAGSNAKKRTKVSSDKGNLIVFREFKLRYASADDVSMLIGEGQVVIPGVATLLREFINKDKSRSSVTLSRSREQPGDVRIEEDVKRFNRQQATTVDIQRQVAPSIVAHPGSNSVWIQDRAERMPLYAEMIEAMDVEPAQVEIEATIIDINQERQRELGVNWRLGNGVNEFLLGQGSSQDTLLRPGQVITPQGSGGILSMVLGDRTKFIARMRALEEQGVARIVSKPHVLTMSNVEATLSSTSEFFVRLEGQDAVSLERQTFGTILRVIPRVFETDVKRGVKLLITIEDGVVSHDAVDNIPGIERSAVSTQALVDEGQSLLLGGLVRESVRNGESKVPLLGDIPGVGRLFRSDTRSSVKTERLFLITPRVAGKAGSSGVGSGPILQGESAGIIASSEQRMGDTFQQIDSRLVEAANSADVIRQPAEPTGKPESPPSHSDSVNLQALLQVPELADPNGLMAVLGKSPLEAGNTEDASSTNSTRWSVRDWTESNDAGWRQIGQ